MKIIDVIKTNKKIQFAIIFLFFVLIVFCYLLFKLNKEKQVQPEVEKDLLQIVNEFSETIENKEDPKVILEKVNDFEESLPEKKSSEDLLKITENFSQNSN